MSTIIWPFSNGYPHLHFRFRNFRPQSVILLFLVIALILPVGCATTTRLNQFQQFAEAGNRFATATTALTTEAGNAAIDTDSMILMVSREAFVKANVKEKLTPEETKELNKTLRDNVLESNKVVLNYVEVLDKVESQVRLLQDYFEALSALAASKAPSGIGQAAQGTVDALGNLSPQIKEAKIDNISVSQFTGAVVPIVVAKFQHAALEKELRDHATMVEGYLDTQQAALEAISSYLETDQKRYAQNLMSRQIVQPYANLAASLPGTWLDRRRELLTKTLTSSAAQNAAGAAKNLKLAFVALAENRLDLASIQDIIRESNEILALVEKIKTPQKQPQSNP